MHTADRHAAIGAETPYDIPVAVEDSDSPNRPREAR
jgi:hypothetical protein